MNLQNKYDFSDTDAVVSAPLAVYCSKCDLRIQRGHVVRRFDGATFYHIECPDRALRQYSDSRRSMTSTARYPFTLVLN